ncbi:hypothetical protein LCGC14_2977180 [marine sediment metagenome]|uniref:Uncharacterized protein n=1 Tax=marine sediment metagenome TaxID=412755 RepID=A0A0F8XV39_9ZZZZ
MQVWELIRNLRKFDGNSTVVVDGYEDGFNDPRTPEEIEVYLNKEDIAIFGKYREVFYNPSKPITKAVYIGR